jgi:membrane glycosyltransferase
MGIMSYLASPLWLLLIVLGLLLALQVHFLQPEYFPHRFALFPTWPIFDAASALRLFIGTMAVLLAPKVLSFLLLVKDRERVQHCGGVLRAGASVLLEVVISSLLAPVTMLMQSAVVMSILTGRDAGWKAQRRDNGSLPLRTLVRYHRFHTLSGVLLAVAAYIVSPSLLTWMSPVVLGLLLAIPVSAATGGQALGKGFRRLGLLVTPEETEPPAVLQRANALLGEWEARCLPETEALVRLADDARLRTLHAEMLPIGHERPKGEYNIDLLLGVAKLDDADSIEEAATLLTSREKLVVLAHRGGFQRLCQLGPE